MDDDNWALIQDRAITVYLDVPFPMVWGRIRNVPGRPLLAGRSVSDVQELYERRRQRYEEAPTASTATGPRTRLRRM